MCSEFDILRKINKNIHASVSEALYVFVVKYFIKIYIFTSGILLSGECYASKFGKLISGHRTGKDVFIPIPKKGNAKEYS